ncbi:DUF6069 family protein [Streptomyces sp. YKOK-I1]
MTGELTATRSARPGRALIAGGLVAAAVVATALDAAVAAIAHAAGASDDFQPLELPTYAALTLIGIMAGAAGWAVVRARSTGPGRLLRVLVPVVLLVSLVPDVLVGMAQTQPGASWGGAVALMVMHLAVAAVAVPTYLRVLPLSARRD